ncbi:MAG TPA: hypothetical protein VFG20_20410, partial [Planctomycetaceae bacterium]|nr:hypothetical protein [Planctomycetaceae bacterium]
DSFLDVVCNIVGVLIILLVMAGMRANQLPVVLPDEAASPQPAIPTESVSPPLMVEVPPEAVPAERPTIPLPVEDEPLPPLEPPAEFVAAAESLDDEIRSLNETVRAAKRKLTESHESLENLEQRLQTAKSLYERKATEAVAVEQQQAATTAALDSLRETIAQLQGQLRESQAQPPAAGSQIEHRITPMSRVISGEERHFQLLHNRVAIVPMEKFKERLKDQVERKKDIMAKTRQHHAQIGPIDGFLLKFIMQRDSLSAVDELRNGPGMYRISIVHFEIEPQPELVTETAEQALTPGSRFYGALLEAPADTTMTFWVYPDSFDIYGKLRALCHSENFLVAGRPLPEGVPIAGSPSGSRSSGQ